MDKVLCGALDFSPLGDVVCPATLVLGVRGGKVGDRVAVQIDIPTVGCGAVQLLSA
jgi:hypothetical protein